MRSSVASTCCAVDDAVVEPIRDVLRRDPQRRAVFHQADVVDVRHLRAADALLDPAHDVAEDSLRVVVELALDLLRAELPREQRRREDAEQQLLRSLRLGSRAPSGARPRRPGDSGSRAASRRWVRAPTRSSRRPSDAPASCRASRASRRASPTCLCRSARGPAARPRGPPARSSPRRPRSSARL